MAEKTEASGGQVGSIPRNVILVGQKPLMSYVTAVLMQLSSGSKDVSIKARGRAISKAVSVVEVVRRRFMKDRVDVVDVQIGTEVLGEDRSRNVSTIEVKLERKD